MGSFFLQAYFNILKKKLNQKSFDVLDSDLIQFYLNFSCDLSLKVQCLSVCFASREASNTSSRGKRFGSN